MFGMNLTTLAGIALVAYAAYKVLRPLVPALWSRVKGLVPSFAPGPAAAADDVSAATAFAAVTTLGTYLAKSKGDSSFKAVVAAVKTLEPAA